jgi:hypothetical protein
MEHPNYMEDNLTKIEYDGHTWEFGYFGEKNNGFSAYGFRQDGIYIRVTSKYEAELFASCLTKLACK